MNISQSKLKYTGTSTSTYIQYILQLLAVSQPRSLTPSPVAKIGDRCIIYFIYYRRNNDQRKHLLLCWFGDKQCAHNLFRTKHIIVSLRFSSSMILKLKITALCVGILCLLKSTAAAAVTVRHDDTPDPTFNRSTKSPYKSRVPSAIPSISAIPSVSPAPSGIPSSSPSPSVSSAPTEYCKCCNCTHTSGCQPGT